MSDNKVEVEDIIEINTDDYKKRPQNVFTTSPGLFGPFDPVAAPPTVSTPLEAVSIPETTGRPATAADLFTPPPIDIPKIESLNIEEVIAKARLPNGGIDFAAVKEAQDKYWANFASSMEQMKASNMARFASQPTTAGAPRGALPRGGPQMNHRGATPLPGAPSMGRPMASPAGAPMSFTSEDFPRMRLQQRISSMESQRKGQL